MIRNHLIDPESSPSKGSFSGNMNTSSEAEDPWYSSNQSSPVSNNVGSFGNYSNFPSSYNAPHIPSVAGITDSDFDDFENEPPLLEELGVRFDHILNKTQAVVNPTKSLSEHILDDADLAGPLFFCLLLGTCLLLSGKIHFGYIYGFSVFGCLSMNVIINLLHTEGLDFWRTCSVLGYSLIPVIGLAGMSILIDLRGTLGFLLSLIVISWSTFSSTRIFDAKLHLTEQYWLVAYPTMLLYSCFVLITIF